jgi:hypothetical protein
MDEKKLSVPEAKQIQMLTELQKVSEKAKKFQNYEFVFIAFEEKGKDCELNKMAFWLNIFNFLTLFRIAEICLNKPSILKKLTQPTMWQSFQANNWFWISGARLSQYDILYSILAEPGKQMEMTQFMRPKTARADFPPSIQKLMVEQCNLAGSGLWFPCKSFP